MIVGEEDVKLFLIEIGAKFGVKEKVLLQSEFGQLLGGEYRAGDVVFMVELVIYTLITFIVLISF